MSEGGTVQRDDHEFEDYFWQQWDLLNEEAMDAAWDEHQQSGRQP